MVLLCWGSTELLLGWAFRMETHIGTQQLTNVIFPWYHNLYLHCGRKHKNTGKLKDLYNFTIVILSLLALMSQLVFKEITEDKINSWIMFLSCRLDCRIRDGINGIHLTTDRMGRRSGRAFLEMEHEEDVSKALEKHRQYMGPRYVEGLCRSVYGRGLSRWRQTYCTFVMFLR